MHLHLDPVGGVAGDMFAAAILNAFPELEAGLLAAIETAGLDRLVQIQHRAHLDHTCSGSRFLVRRAPLPTADPSSAGSTGDPGTKESSADHHDHHRSFRDIKALLEKADLSRKVRQRAIEIFSLLAEAEGQVHGQPPEEVHFHEVGAWDSIADIVCAAWLIEEVGATSWSSAPLPIGRGRVHSAHGELPLPAPATARLLLGFPLFQDGREGERITPTGAAILRHLGPSFDPLHPPARLSRLGTGFGTRTFPDLSNVLRVLAFETPREVEPGIPPRAWREETITVCRFEVDDQSAEDLAAGLEALRLEPMVLDVSQAPLFGKKGRLVTQIQVLARSTDLPRVLDRCFTETTTLGIRYQTVMRALLPREQLEVEVAGQQVAVKRTQRPSQATTHKAEHDDVARLAAGHGERETLRRRAEAAADSPKKEGSRD
ncbi:MAG: LarC family nickel insertion protein [Deltaproteobacteria bacterium]|nr:LarC family nickel insertion protein [Deltaproteobacteria bacterium]